MLQQHAPIHRPYRPPLPAAACQLCPRTWRGRLILPSLHQAGRHRVRQRGAITQPRTHAAGRLGIAAHALLLLLLLRQLRRLAVRSARVRLAQHVVPDEQSVLCQRCIDRGILGLLGRQPGGSRQARLAEE